MGIRKTLTHIVLLGSLALSDCSNPKQYTLARYGRTENGKYIISGMKLGNEWVTFCRVGSGQNFYDYTNRLEVAREDGTSITYIDEADDLLVDGVKIHDKNRDMIDETSVVEKQALKQAQQQFNDYLQRILEYKQKIAVDLK